MQTSRNQTEISDIDPIIYGKYYYSLQSIDAFTTYSKLNLTIHHDICTSVRLGKSNKTQFLMIDQNYKHAIITYSIFFCLVWLSISLVSTNILNI